ncbi:MAG TPA: hypothetical protein VF698_17440 [Thermoanaerobaculia bacterium]|jgi:hypothetical protein
MTPLLVTLMVLAALLLLLVLLRKSISPVLGVSLAFMFAFWYVTPVVTTGFFWERVARSSAIRYDTFVSYAIIEVAGLLGILFLLAITRPTFRFVTEGKLASMTLSPRLMSLAIVAACALEVILRRLTWSMVGGGNYFDQNAFSTRYEGTVAAANVGIVFSIELVVRAFLYACAVTPGATRSRLVTILLWSVIIFTSLNEVLIGGRFALLSPCVLALMYVHMKRISRTVLVATYAAAAVFVATVGAIILISIAEVRGGNAVTLRDVSRQTQLVRGKSLGDRLGDLFFHINLKLDAISSGAFLVQSYGSGVAGMRPYQGAILSIVPRRILPSKPVPGSVDGTNRGTPARLVPIAQGLDVDISNMTVSPAAISVWQFGLLGLIPLVVLNYLQLCFINSLLVPRSVFTRTFAMLLLTIPSFGGLVASGDFVIMTGERALAMFVAATLAIVATRFLFGSRPPVARPAPRAA